MTEAMESAMDDIPTDPAPVELVLDPEEKRAVLARIAHNAIKALVNYDPVFVDQIRADVGAL